MKSGEVLRLVLKKFGFKAAALDLGLALSYLYNWCAPDNGKSTGSLNPLERVAQLVRFTGDRRPVQWLCEQAGGYFVPNPQVKAHAPEQLLAAHSRVVREFGELIALVCEAAGDNRITVPEAQRIRQRWEALKTLTEDFAQCCERGDFLVLQAAMLRQASPQSPARLAPPENDTSPRAQA